MGMNRLARFTACLTGFICIGFTAQAQDFEMRRAIDNHQFDPGNLIWMEKPAAKWEEAIPIGNGRLGAMVYGATTEETIQLNEDTYFTGGPYSTVVKGGHKHLAEVQQLVFEEKYFAAQKLFARELMGYPVEQMKYQSLGHIKLFFPKEHARYQHYARWLDLEKGISSVSYEVNGVKYNREVLASFPDQTIAIRITASKPGSISFTANLRGQRNQAHSNYATDYFRMDGQAPDQLILRGKSADYLGVKGQLRYEARLKATLENGSIEIDDENMIIRNADAVTLYLVAATNFVNYKDVSADQAARVQQGLQQLKGKTYAQVRQAHLADYTPIFQRVKLRLPLAENTWLPTPERTKLVRWTADPSLASLAYQFGRYVLISASRPGSQPANLQGIWNEDMNPWWDAKMTTNINLEMNYWMVESGNLSEMFEPFTRLMEELTDQGSQVAREHYGARGWVFHQNTDLWRVAAPMDGSTWGTFTVGGAWLATHLWEHYRYAKDKDYLKRIYPVLKGSVDFFMDFLVEDPRTGYLVTNPSNSPENFPVRKGSGPYFDEITASFRPSTNVCAGSTIDMQILHDLFTYYSEATRDLGVDSEYAREVTAARNRLVPPLVGKDGSLQEWAQDWGQLETTGHRHNSHLYGLYPGNMLSYTKTPDIMPAVEKALVMRTDSSHGNAEWSMAWKVNLWSRLKDGEHAHRILNLYLARHALPQLFSGMPMQVDGTLGAAAGVSEMLLQSQEDIIELLPATPAVWKEGRFQGVKARNGFELDFEWKDNAVQKVAIRSTAGETCRIRFSPRFRLTDQRGKTVRHSRSKDGVVQFATVRNGQYLLEAI